MKNPNLVPTPITTKDGVQTTVYTKPEQPSAGSARVASASAAPPMKPFTAQVVGYGVIKVHLRGESLELNRLDSAFLLEGLDQVTSNPGYGVEWIAPRPLEYDENYKSDRVVTAVTEKYGEVRLSITVPEQHIHKMSQSEASDLFYALFEHRDTFPDEMIEVQQY